MSDRKKAIADKLAKSNKKARKEENLGKFVKYVLPVTAFLAVVVGAIFLFVNISGQVSAEKEAEQELANSKGEQFTPETVTENGSFRVSTFDVSENPDAVKMEYFFDPQCPSCGVVERNIGGEVNSLLENEEINLYLYPVSFLNRSSTDNYSSRAASAVVTVIEESPEHAMDFIGKIFEENFQPHQGEAYMSVSDQDLTDAAVSVGVPEEVAETFKERHYVDWVLENTETQINRTDFFNDDFSTTSVFLNAEYVDGEAKTFIKVSFNQGDILTSFKMAIAEAKNN